MQNEDLSTWESQDCQKYVKLNFWQNLSVVLPVFPPNTSFAWNFCLITSYFLHFTSFLAVECTVLKAQNDKNSHNSISEFSNLEFLKLKRSNICIEPHLSLTKNAKNVTIIIFIG